MARILLATIGLPLLGGCGEQGDKAFAESFDKSFRSSCVASAARPGVSEDIAGQLCDCALNEINSKYSTMEKVALSDDELLPMVKTCAEKVVPK